MAIVTITSLPLIDTNSMMDLLEKHRTRDPEVALKAERIRYSTIPHSEFHYVNKRIVVDPCVEKETTKVVFVLNDEIFVVLSPIKTPKNSHCAAQ